MAATFEWDPVKAEANRRKHGIAFSKAISAFRDPLSVTILDPDHSLGEERYLLLGENEDGQLLVVAHTDKSEHIRIISARRASRRERRDYERR